MPIAAKEVQLPEDIPSRILNAALNVFAEHGYNGAATREIARRASVHQPSIAYHFGSKEHLWKAAAKAVFTKFSDAMHSNLQNVANDEDRLRRLAELYVRFVAGQPEWATFVIQEGMQTGDRSRWLSKTWIEPQAWQLYKAITGRDWPKRNKAAIGEAVSFLAILTGSTLIFAQKAQVKRLSGTDTSSPDFIKQHVKTVYLVLKALQTNADFGR